MPSRPFRQNGLINVYRTSAPSATGVRSLVRWHSRVPARISFRRRSIVTEDGVLIATDGQIQVGTKYQIREGDYIEVEKRREVPAAPTRTKPRYRVEEVNEQMNAGGRIIGLRLSIVKARPKERAS